MPGDSRYKGSTDLVALGMAVRELREARQLAQVAVAYDARVCRGYISAIENGRMNPAFITLLWIARTMRVTLSELAEVYENTIAVIDPQAGSEVPACPTPGALEEVRRVAAKNTADYHATKARRARSRIKPWT